ncbi:MAG: hypothetical protein ABT20_19340 [Rubrivivax sp. SCN 70-15]|nr:MAG: hypothetical protein ABT20_19340 [Rubrivivax sp. SCN 70-15]
MPLVAGLAVALGSGLLIGLERERRKGRGADRAAAGIRSFALAALAGALAQAVGQPLLVATGGALVLVLVGVAYWRSRAAAGTRDPGLTTELALFVTYLVGVLSVQQPALGAGAAVIVTVLLAARERLHRFATRALSEAELHDALLLAALVLVLLPLMPDQPLPWLAGQRPRTLALLMVLILTLQGAGHVALRLFGPRAGLALSGLFSGFVSSTAAIAAMGARARAEPAQHAACEAGAMLSTAATWIQALLMLALLAPAAAAALLPVALPAMAVALASGAWRAWRASAAAAAPSLRGPLRLREAVVVTLLLSAVSLAVGWAQQRFGEAGLLAGAAIGALADAHSSIAALGALHAAGRADTGAVLLGVGVAVATNALTRTATALVAGGLGYGLRVGASLAASTGVAWAVLLLR